MTTATPGAGERLRIWWLAILALLTIGGVALWVYQLSRGLYITDMRNLTSWGLYITLFMLFVGLSAGGLIIATAPRVLGLTGFTSVTKIAVYMSICCAILAGVFVVIDMGRPERLWKLLLGFNLMSPLVWDIIVLTLYLVISTAYLWLDLRAEQGKTSEKTLWKASLIALISAVLVNSVEAWIFGLQIGRPFWNSALMAPLFVSSALTSGLALTLFVVVVLQRIGYIERDVDMNARMARLLGVLAIVDLFMLFCELLTAAFPRGGIEAKVVHEMLAGSFAPLFWVEIVAMVVALVILLGRNWNRTASLVGLAAVLVVLGIFLKRYQLLLAGFGEPNLPYFSITTGPGLSDAGSWWRGLGSGTFYFPSLAEWGIAVGVVAGGVLLFTLGLRYLRLKPVK